MEAVVKDEPSAAAAELSKQKSLGGAKSSSQGRSFKKCKSNGF